MYSYRTGTPNKQMVLHRCYMKYGHWLVEVTISMKYGHWLVEGTISMEYEYQRGDRTLSLNIADQFVM